MLERATRTIRTAALLLAAYFVLNIALRLVLPHSLELDEAEQSFFSQYLLAGYGPQPPFYNWMQYAVVSVTGMSIGALIVPKNILLFLCYLFYGLAGREALKDQALAAVGMLALITLPQVSYMAQQDLTHTTALLFASEHGAMWDVGLAAGLLYNFWMRRTRSLGDLILAHAVTNACLSAYVLSRGRWEYW